MKQKQPDREHVREDSSELAARLRELSFLYEVSDVIDRRGRPFDEIIAGVLGLLPGISSSPDTVCARITIDGREYLTDNFRSTPWGVQSEIISRCCAVGTLEVFSLQERRVKGGGPFTKEEKGLVDNIASRLGRVVARKRSEEMLAESEERYRSLFEDSRDAICTVSQEGIILDANEAALSLFGYNRAGMIGMRAVDLFAFPIGMARLTTELGHKGSLRDFGVQLKRKDGSLMDCLCTCSLRRPAPGGAAAGYHAIVRDITAFKRSEQEKVELIHELKNALESIRTLKGLVPICATCKKIRDDKGYWNRLEEYLEAQTEAVFSHGLCPECQKRFEEE